MDIISLIFEYTLFVYSIYLNIKDLINEIFYYIFTKR